MASNDCDALDPAPSKNYRFFNQPIEQIPGHDPAKHQVLVHSPNCGLQWHTIQCISVVTCIKLDTATSEQKLDINRRKISIIKDIEEIQDDTECPDIPLTECPESGGGGVSGLSVNSAGRSYEFDEKTQTWICTNKS